MVRGEFGHVEYSLRQMGEIDLGVGHVRGLVASFDALSEHRHSPMLESAVVVDGRRVETGARPIPVDGVAA